MFERRNSLLSPSFVTLSHSHIQIKMCTHGCENYIMLNSTNSLEKKQFASDSKAMRSRHKIKMFRKKGKNGNYMETAKKIESVC